jgi:hypothetical protein
LIAGKRRQKTALGTASLKAFQTEGKVEQEKRALLKLVQGLPEGL